MKRKALMIHATDGRLLQSGVVIRMARGTEVQGNDAAEEDAKQRRSTKY